MYSEEDVRNYVREEDVKFIRLVFTTVFGLQKNISIMENELGRAFSEGITIDSSFIDGYEKYKRIVLHPDPDTIALLPWRPSQGRVIRMFCTLSEEDGTPIGINGRYILERAISDTSLNNIKLRARLEFCIFRLDEEGHNTSIPYDDASYMDIAPADKGENLRREICLSLQDMEIETCGSFHLKGPGQNQITLSSYEPLKAAESAITFESVVKTIASRNGLYADFGYSSSNNDCLSRHQIVIEVDKDMEDIYYQRIRSHYDEIYLFLNNSEYLYSGYDEKTNVTLNRYRHEITMERISSSANFYLIYALILYALSDDNDVNEYKSRTLLDAKENAKKSPFVNKYLPEELLEFYIK